MIDAAEDDCLVMSLVENLARRQHTPLELVRGIGALKQRGYRHLLLDGNLRFAILQERGATQVRCLLASDDESFTYNKRINRLATIQEHYMIVRALKRGVSEEKLARALNVDVRAIKRRRILLDGICPEVVDLPKDRTVNGSRIGTV